MSEQNIEVVDQRKHSFALVDDVYLDEYAAVCGIYATGVYLAICRHANANSTCFPGKDYLAKKLGISVRSVYKATQALVDNGIIAVNKSRRSRGGKFESIVYSLVDKSLWKPLMTPATVGIECQRHQVPTKNNTNTNTIHTNTNTVNRAPGAKQKPKVPEKTTEEIAPNAQADKQLGEIAQIFKIFYESVNPTINFGNKTQRGAVEAMINRIGFEKTKRAAEYAVSIQGEKYAPTITTPYILKEKMGELTVYFKKNNQGSSSITINDSDYGQPT